MSRIPVAAVTQSVRTEGPLAPQCVADPVHASLERVARSEQDERRTPVDTDVLTLLEQDHRHVERLLDQLADSQEGPEREAMVRRLDRALSLHKEALLSG